MIRHIVMFKIKEGLNKDEKTRELKDALEQLPGKINEIKHYEIGINETESDRAFDISLVSDFNNNESLDAYRIHPEHQKVVGLIKNICDQTVVVDYTI